MFDISNRRLAKQILDLDKEKDLYCRQITELELYRDKLIARLEAAGIAVPPPDPLPPRKTRRGRTN